MRRGGPRWLDRRHGQEAACLALCGGERGREGEESAVASIGFLKRRRRGRGGGEVRLGAAWRARTEKEEGAPGAACDNAAARQRPTAARPQCRAVAPVDRRARAAQCRVT
jgi:hypothetical protein